MRSSISLMKLPNGSSGFENSSKALKLRDQFAPQLKLRYFPTRGQRAWLASRPLRVGIRNETDTENAVALVGRGRP